MSRSDFPSGNGSDGPVGDYYGLQRLIDRHPEWSAQIIELNTGGIEVDWSVGGFRLRNEGGQWFDLDSVRTAIFVPICLEPEETVLRSSTPGTRWPRFEIEQWRPISALFEARLDAMSGARRCINPPAATRATNNKLVQFERLRAAGFELPETRVMAGFPRQGLLADQARLVSKNVSEGGWRSPTEFSPARVVERDEPAEPSEPAEPAEPAEPWPTIWQTPIVSPQELRVYVMGDDVIGVALDRDPDVLDVRSVNDGQPSASIVDIPIEWAHMLLSMTRCLGLDYAVIDAIPADGTLHVLEVNANGVWWFLPPDVGSVLEARFHLWLERIISRP